MITDERIPEGKVLFMPEYVIGTVVEKLTTPDYSNVPEVILRALDAAGWKVVPKEADDPPYRKED